MCGIKLDFDLDPEGRICHPGEGVVHMQEVLRPWKPHATYRVVGVELHVLQNLRSQGKLEPLRTALRRFGIHA